MNAVSFADATGGAAVVGALALLLFWCLLLLVGAGLFVFWLWMLIHALRNRGLTDGERVAWVVVICLTHVLGALLYLILGRPKAAEAPAGASGPLPMPAPPAGPPSEGGPAAPPMPPPAGPVPPAVPPSLPGSAAGGG